ncbi:DUF4160 domain-containing protein [Sphingomonas gilva]|uniref:DUF4160 domain-containing protein n=1 Tax=Sphingomonas gilva TaxID=2305907 RepID=A0A396RVC3_9SPHN|nr:DUF4160 domain-containing protein [Sphingomonas gilva]RHW17621.1 DUF4160 domain-containing protein [Sphingomonas gilva]
MHYHAAPDPLLRVGDRDVFADHNPPHFHVLGREGAAQVRIDTLEVIASSGRIDLREALAWAADNRPLLEAKWQEFSGDGA